jgi:MFS family permease
MNTLEENPKKYKKTYLYCVIANALIGSFYLGYQTSIINSLQLYLANDVFHWSQQDSDYYIGCIAAMIPAGAVIGSLLSGYFAQKLGRRWSIIIANAIGIAGMIIACVTNIYVMIAGWFLNGVSVGLNTMLSTLYINEVSPVELRGLNGCFVNMFMNIGCLIAYAMAYILPFPYQVNPQSNNWRALILLPGIMLAVQAILFLAVFRSDTPKYLVFKGQELEAKEFLDKIYSGSPERSLHHYEMLRLEKSKDQSYVEVKFHDLFGKKYSKRTLTGSLLVIFHFFTGVFVILTYSTSIFLGEGSTAADESTPQMYDEARNLTTLFGGLGVIAAIPASWIAVHVGRRILLLIGFPLIIVLYIVFEIFPTGIGADVSLLIFVVALNCTVAIVAWVYLPEILPDVGVGFVFLIFWTTYAVGVFGFPVLVQYTSLRLAFGIFIGMCALGFIWALLWFKETKDKSNSEIIEMFCPIEHIDGKDDEVVTDAEDKIKEIEEEEQRKLLAGE